jgi:two-component system sensor histidine kinase CreC
VELRAAGRTKPARAARRALTIIAPMSRRTRILLALIAVYAIGMAALLYQLLADLDPRYRESAEEGLIETAQLMATVIEQEVEHGALPTDRIGALFRDLYARRFSAQIYQLHKTRVELRAYVTNRHGVVVYDSTGRDLGKDYAGWRDVRNTLRGEYGARTTRDVAGDADSAVMYVGAPIRWQGEIVGAVSLGKPVQSFGQFVSAARSNILYVGLMSGLSALVLALVLSFLLIRPLGITTDLLAALRTAWWHDARGRRRFSPRRAWRALRAQARAAYQEVRDAVAGRNYVQDYVQQLTHELKSPLSAVRGAAELLQEPELPPTQAARFAANIERESLRMQEVVDRMMELTALESRRLLQDQQRVALAPMLRELAAAAHARAPALRIDVVAPDDVAVEGDPSCCAAPSATCSTTRSTSPAPATAMCPTSCSRWRAKGVGRTLPCATTAPACPPTPKTRCSTSSSRWRAPARKNAAPAWACPSCRRSPCCTRAACRCATPWRGANPRWCPSAPRRARWPPCACRRLNLETAVDRSPSLGNPHEC